MTDILFPVGRMVWGSMYKPRTTDFDNKPLVVKTGPDAGKPTQRYEFGVAYPKNGAQHFSQTAWGAIIWKEAFDSFRNGEPQRDDFAFKVLDGDSVKPNKRNARPCDQEGYPGHFIVTFSSTFPPKLTNADGTLQILEPDAIKCGYYVEVFGNVSGNKNLSNPGVFINHEYVALAGYGPVINTGTDPRSIGFGAGQLPPGASQAPIGGQFAPAPAAPGGYPAPAPQGYPAPAPYGGAPAPQGAPQYQQPAPVAQPPAYNPHQPPQYQQPAPGGYPAPPPQAPQGYTPPAPQGYAPPGQPAGPQGYAPQPPQGYAPPAPGGYPAPAGAAPGALPAPGYGHAVQPVPSFINGPQR